MKLEEVLDMDNLNPVQQKMYTFMNIVMQEIGDYRMSTAELLGIIEVWKLHWVMQKKCSDPSDHPEQKLYTRLNNLAMQLELTTFQVCAMAESIKGQINEGIDQMINKSLGSQATLKALSDLLKDKEKILEGMIRDGKPTG